MGNRNNGYSSNNVGDSDNGGSMNIDKRFGSDSYYKANTNRGDRTGAGNSSRRSSSSKGSTPPNNRKPKGNKKNKETSGNFGGKLLSSTEGVVLYIGIIIAISIVLSAVAIYAANDVFAFFKEDREITINFEEDTKTSSSGKILKENGVVDLGFLFNLFTRFTTDGSINVIRPGEYNLNSNMDYRAILSVLRRAVSNRRVIDVTIPEGYTVTQIMELLISKGVSEEESLIDTLTNYPFKHDFLVGLPLGELNRLDGYLFPDTYQFYENDNSVSVINKILNNFNKKYDGDLSAQVKESKYSLHEIMTIASLIEREAKLETEQTKISGVIYNRLNNPKSYPYLEIDASIQYAVGHNNTLTQEDLEIDSPYNTRKYKGLPPGPISNPGYSAIYAALNPDSHKYYFYVADVDGSHIFTKTLAEHNKAKQLVKSKQDGN